MLNPIYQYEGARLIMVGFQFSTQFLWRFISWFWDDFKFLCFISVPLAMNCKFQKCKILKCAYMFQKILYLSSFMLKQNHRLLPNTQESPKHFD